MWTRCLMVMYIIFGVVESCSSAFRLDLLRGNELVGLTNASLTTKRSSDLPVRNNLAAGLQDDTPAGSMSCNTFGPECSWKTADSSSLPWYQSQIFIEPNILEIASGSSVTPNGSYAICLSETVMPDGARAILESDPICLSETGHLQLTYWSSVGVNLRVCQKLINAADYFYCTLLPHDRIPGPASVSVPSLGGQMFTLNVIADNFTFTSPDYSGGFAIVDSMTYRGASCLTQNVVATTTSSSASTNNTMTTTVSSRTTISSTNGNTVAMQQDSFPSSYNTNQYSTSSISQNTMSNMGATKLTPSFAGSYFNNPTTVSDMTSSSVNPASTVSQGSNSPYFTSTVPLNTFTTVAPYSNSRLSSYYPSTVSPGISSSYISSTVYPFLSSINPYSSTLPSYSSTVPQSSPFTFSSTVPTVSNPNIPWSSIRSSLFISTTTLPPVTSEATENTSEYYDEATEEILSIGNRRQNLIAIDDHNEIEGGPEDETGMIESTNETKILEVSKNENTENDSLKNENELDPEVERILNERKEKTTIFQPSLTFSLPNDVTSTTKKPRKKVKHKNNHKKNHGKKDKNKEIEGGETVDDQNGQDGTIDDHDNPNGIENKQPDQDTRNDEGNQGGTVDDHGINNHGLVDENDGVPSRTSEDIVTTTDQSNYNPENIVTSTATTITTENLHTAHTLMYPFHTTVPNMVNVHGNSENENSNNGPVNIDTVLNYGNTVPRYSATILPYPNMISSTIPTYNPTVSPTVTTLTDNDLEDSTSDTPVNRVTVFIPQVPLFSKLFQGVNFKPRSEATDDDDNNNVNSDSNGNGRTALSTKQPQRFTNVLPPVMRERTITTHLPMMVNSGTGLRQGTRD